MSKVAVAALIIGLLLVVAALVVLVIFLIKRIKSKRNELAEPLVDGHNSLLDV